ncbi:unnamed protein product [Owenia fusiformis]|uniref:Uncharacterized protein n=1 Tax=Owenia fusiformis TaxID=6347 RepID=A0A8J1XIV0_OWEFU|nr:unnamed protein product [Owenia fusiformis]
MPYKTWILNLRAHYRHLFLAQGESISSTTVKLQWAHGDIGPSCLCSENTDRVYIVKYRKVGNMLFKRQRVEQQMYIIIDDLTPNSKYEFVVEDKMAEDHKKKFSERCFVVTKGFSIHTSKETARLVDGIQPINVTVTEV